MTPAIGRSQIIDDYFSFLAVAPARGDTIGLSVITGDRLYFGPAPNGPWDSVDLGAVRRRGAVPSLMEALERGDMRAAETRLYKPSFPVALHHEPSSDAFVLITSDRALEAGSRMTGKLFLSLVVPHTRSACVDHPLPVPSDPQLQVAFRGDTKFVLSQSSDSLAETHTTVRALVLAWSSCA